MKGGYMAECADCGTTQRFTTTHQRHQWITKHHIGHAIWMWRETKITT